ncbi:MAG TPA: lysine transporter LysE [Stenotrophomonas sp.]|nr:lysine transporter LysE [Stenotrophomonas sp.]
MALFLMVASAHFLALLSPGPDFFLIARSAMVHGWRRAAAAAMGITAGNAAYIAAAFSGTALLQQDSWLFSAVQCAGGAYLCHLGIAFQSHAGTSTLDPAGAAPVAAVRSAGVLAAQGLLSALLNPKNGLFYASLASLLAGPDVSGRLRLLIALWMTAAVLLWDLAVSLAIGNRRLLHRFSRALPALERGSGAIMLLLGIGVIGAVLLR